MVKNISKKSSNLWRKNEKNSFKSKWADQVGLVSVPGGKVEVEIVGPGGSSKSNVIQRHHGAWLEPIVEPKHKGSDCNNEKCQVAHAGSVTLKKQNEKFEQQKAYFPFPKQVHRVEYERQGYKVEDHVINKIPVKASDQTNMSYERAYHETPMQLFSSSMRPFT